MENLRKIIKSLEFQNVYLLYGPEDYLRKQYRDKLRVALCPDADDMNYAYFEGKDLSAGAIIDLAETMPFLSERRVIFIEDSGWFKSGGDVMAEYLENICDTTVICFVEKDVDKRSKLFKQVTKHGYAAVFEKQTTETLYKWIASRLQSEGKKIRGIDVNYFLEKTGPEMDNIASELEKLLCYCLDKEIITTDDIDAICSTKLSSHIFVMMDAIAENKQHVALDKYYELLALKESPLMILYMLARQCNNLLMVKQLKNKGKGNQEIASATKLQDFVVRKLVNQCAKFKEETLRNAVESCVSMEHDVKSGKLNDRLAVEMLILSVLK